MGSLITGPLITAPLIAEPLPTAAPFLGEVGANGAVGAGVPGRETTCPETAGTLTGGRIPTGAEGATTVPRVARGDEEDSSEEPATVGRL
jgi:hypothetical protein